MARKQEPQFTCHLCGKPILDFQSAASWDYDYLRSTALFPVHVATCWGCHTGESP